MMNDCSDECHDGDDDDDGGDGEDHNSNPHLQLIKVLLPPLAGQTAILVINRGSQSFESISKHIQTSREHTL